ncbi:hypothetical protein AGMMS49982_04370 [Bacteroidia bacterium]|nr:hypothetical protein AGMMS49982_04370 [Bacteroidia bacterium]
MGKILEYIQQSGNGKFQCYKTKKLSLDSHDDGTIAYACNRQQPPVNTLYQIAEILQVSVKNLLVDNKRKV